MCWNLFQVSPVRCWACTPGAWGSSGDLSQAFLLQSVLRTERYRSLNGNCLTKLYEMVRLERKLTNDQCGWGLWPCFVRIWANCSLLTNVWKIQSLTLSPAESNTANCPMNLFQFCRNLKGEAGPTASARLSSFSQIYLDPESWLSFSSFYRFAS